jgi:hypothetical protein
MGEWVPERTIAKDTPTISVVDTRGLRNQSALAPRQKERNGPVGQNLTESAARNQSGSSRRSSRCHSTKTPTPLQWVSEHIQRSGYQQSRCAERLQPVLIVMVPPVPFRLPSNRSPIARSQRCKVLLVAVLCPCTTENRHERE